MKVPVSWLKEYVDFEDSIEGLTDKLTFSGIEVEGVRVVGCDMTGMTVGEVRGVDRHPNADRLSICRVFDGTTEHRVVCGAPNVKAGMKSAFAPVGTTLANGMKLKKAKIRGEASSGMLCAEDELGLSDDHEGIIVLDDQLSAGTPLAEALGRPEPVLELEITPNRPDCLSILGVAREVAALYGTALKRPDTTLKESDPPVTELTKVEVDDVEGCPRYTARIISGIRIGPSPRWMQKRLTLCGLRPISNIVDITNYVMLETGHPLHAFDQALLEEGRIAVRRARPDEHMNTLDGVERELSPEMLVIADAKQPVALAGIMGGAGSEIRDDTQTVLLESACFKLQDIRKTSRQLELSTESSYRFERGVDVGGVEWGSRRAAALMAEYAGGVIARGVIDVYPQPYQERKVTCRWQRVKSLLGIDVENRIIRETFESLDLPVAEADDECITVLVPSFRSDLEREVDLIEEFARMYGLENIPAPSPQARVVPGAEDNRTRAMIQLRNRLVALGLQETMNYSMVSDALLDLFDPSDRIHRVVLPYPISSEQSVMRSSLIPQMAVSLGRNLARQVSEARFFELGRIYVTDTYGAITEQERLALGILGPVGRSSLEKRKPPTADEMFYWMKGMIESLLASQRIRDWSLEGISLPCFENRHAVRIRIDGVPSGTMGILSNSVRSQWRMTDPVCVAELKVDPLLVYADEISPYKGFAPYPPVVRDIAIILDNKIKHKEVLEVILQAAPKELEKVNLFDIFEGEGIGDGKKSMAYSLTYRSDQRSLTDEDANELHDVVKNAIRDSLRAEIREN